MLADRASPVWCPKDSGYVYTFLFLHSWFLMSFPFTDLTVSFSGLHLCMGIWSSLSWVNALSQSQNTGLLWAPRQFPTSIDICLPILSLKGRPWAASAPHSQISQRLSQLSFLSPPPYAKSSSHLSSSVHLFGHRSLLPCHRISHPHLSPLTIDAIYCVISQTTLLHLVSEHREIKQCPLLFVCACTCMCVCVGGWKAPWQIFVSSKHLGGSPEPLGLSKALLPRKLDWATPLIPHPCLALYQGRFSQICISLRDSSSKT